MNKLLCITLAIWLAVFIAATANAKDRYRDDEKNVTNVYVTEVTEVYEITEVSNQYTTDEYTTQINDIADGTALAIANSQLHFDWATNDWQIGIGLGNYDSSNAGSVGIAKRVGSVLINGSFNQGFDSSKEGYGIGATMRFK